MGAAMKPWRSTFITNGVILGSGLVGGVLAARLLGVEDRGLLAAIIFWPHFVVGVGAMGLNEGITIRTAKLGVTKTLIATTFTLSLVLALPLGAIGYFLIPWLLGESRSDYFFFSQLYFLAFLPMSFLAMNLIAIDQGEFKFHNFNIQRIIQAVTYPLILLGCWLGGLLTVEVAAIAVMAGTVIVALLRIWFFRKGLTVFPSFQESYQLIVQSFRLHVVNILMFFSLQIDKMALVLFSSNTQLGFYVIAVTAAGVIPSLFVQTYINIMLPTAAKLGAGRYNIQELLIPLRKLLLIIALLAVLLVMLIPYLVTIVYGGQFYDAGEYAQVLVLAFSLAGVKKVLIYLLRSWHLHRSAIYGEGVTAFIMIVGAYIAVHWWGTMGLCVLVLLAQAVGTVVLIHFFLKKMGLTLRQFVQINRI